MRVSFWPVVTFALAVGVVACEATGVGDPAREVQRLSLAQKAIDVGVDEVQQLTIATAPSGDVSWKSANPGVATVSNSGLVSGRAIGQTMVIAASKRSTDTAVVSVHAPIANIAVTPDSATILTGQSMRLSFSAYDKTGKSIGQISNSSAKWQSSDPTVATVSNDGVVSGMSRGITSITLIINGKSARAFVRISPLPVARVVLSPAPSANMKAGGTLKLSAEAQDSTGKALSDWIVVWQSADSSVATVSSSGTVTAYKAGSTVVTAIAGNKQAQTTVFATPAVIYSVAVLVNASSIQIGQTTQAAATAYDSSGNQISGRPVTWSSGSPSIATVSSSGGITGVANGKAKIIATVDGITGSVDETVSSATIANLSVVLAKSLIAAGDTTRAKAVATDAAGNEITGRTVTWSSSNPAIATVSNLGLVTGVGAGTVSISALVDGLTSQGTVVVTSPVVSSVTVSAPLTTLTAGQTTQGTAQLRDASGATVTGPVTWTTSAPSVASVSSTGLISAIGTGTADITATSGTISGKLGITVAASIAPLGGVTPPELPRSYINTDYPAAGGTVRNVPAGGDLQGALNAAAPGDQIVLAPGAVYSGNFVLAREERVRELHRDPIWWPGQRLPGGRKPHHSELCTQAGEDRYAGHCSGDPGRRRLVQMVDLARRGHCDGTIVDSELQLRPHSTGQRRVERRNASHRDRAGSGVHPRREQPLVAKRTSAQFGQHGDR